jgi:hypothetical protein
VTRVRGSWPRAATIELSGEGGERVGSIRESRTWQTDHWADVPSAPEAPSRVPWLNGATLERAHELYPSFTVVPSGAAPAPNFTAIHVKDATPYCRFREASLLTRPSGELFLVGTYCGIYPTHGDQPVVGPMPSGEAGVVRWAPGGAAKLEAIPDVAHHADLVLSDLVESPNKTLFLFGSVAASANGKKPGAYLATNDGTAWSRIETPYAGEVSHHEMSADGSLWIWADHALFERRADGSWNREPLDDVRSVFWAQGRPDWAALPNALAHRGADGKWTRIPAPRPAFSLSAELDLQSVSVSPKGEVWSHASYQEKRPEWTQPERREALLRLGAPAHAPEHCDVAMGSSFSSWPPPATPSCAHVVAILARISKSAPANYDFPQTRRALRGHAEIGGAQFVEIDVDGKRLLAAKVDSMDMGKRLAEIVRQGVPGTRPELVCAEPKVTRVVQFDLGSGTLKVDRPTARQP